MGAIKTPTPVLPPGPASPSSASTPPLKVGASSTSGSRMAGAFFWVEMFFVVYCARPEDWIPGLHFIPLAKVAGLFALIAFILSIGSAKSGLPKEVFYLGALTVQMGLASIFSTLWKGGAIQVTEDFAKVVLIMAVMSMCVVTLDRLRRLIYLQTVSAGLIAAISIVKGHQMGGRLEGVLNGIYSNPNDLALAMALTFPFCFAFMIRAKNPVRKVFWVLIMLVMVYCVLMTASRGGLIGLLIGAGVCIWGFGVKQRRVLLVFFVFVATIIMLPLAGKLALQRLGGTFDPNQNVAESYDSAQARKELLQKSLTVSVQHPLFGVGPGDFQIISGWHETHDVYTELSAEAGIPALIIFLMIFYRAFRNVWDARQSIADRSELATFATAVKSALAVFAVSSLFYPVAYHFFVYFLFAFATALYRIASSCGAYVSESQDTRHHPGAVQIRQLLPQTKRKAVWTT
ncbi:MAG TPA: O-antigen ligase family protein [Terriglobia bacterium]|nr:O-antigen ligase family protein [Terriglobia bacterium]